MAEIPHPQADIRISVEPVCTKDCIYSCFLLSRTAQNVTDGTFTFDVQRVTLESFDSDGSRWSKRLEVLKEIHSAYICMAY